MIANRLWIIEYRAINGSWYPTLPREWFEFKYDALRELERRQYADGGMYRAAAYSVKP